MNASACSFDARVTLHADASLSSATVADSAVCFRDMSSARREPGRPGRRAVGWRAVPCCAWTAMLV